MNPSVYFQIIFSVKSFLAHAAEEWSMICVHSHVSFQAHSETHTNKTLLKFGKAGSVEVARRA